MQCVWFLIASFLFLARSIGASEKKCDAVTFGNGTYDFKRGCWEKKPTIPKLEVESKCQSLTLRRKLLRALKCRPGIKKFLEQKSYDCEPSKISGIGLTNICPSEYKHVTAIVRNSETCYVVYPNRQCITYVNCEANVDCSKNGSVKSACLPDRHRFFNVWVFCPYFHRFELETLELPQCCTCREYKLCEDSRSATTSPIPIAY